MVPSNDEIKNLLAFLEPKYPETYASLESLKMDIGPQIKLDKFFKLFFFCWDEGLIKCTPIEEKAGGVIGFSNIRIHSSGIKFLHEL